SASLPFCCLAAQQRARVVMHACNRHPCITICITTRARCCAARQHQGTRSKFLLALWFCDWLAVDRAGTAGRGGRLQCGASCPHNNLAPGACVDSIGGAPPRVPVWETDKIPRAPAPAVPFCILVPLFWRPRMTPRT